MGRPSECQKARNGAMLLIELLQGVCSGHHVSTRVPNVFSSCYRFSSFFFMSDTKIQVMV